MTDKKIALEIIEILQDAGFDYDSMIKVIKLAREKLIAMQKNVILGHTLFLN